MKEVLGRCSSVYVYFYVSMHVIVVLSTCFDEIHGMSLYEVVLLYKHNAGLNEYMMKLLFGIYNFFLCFLVDV